MATSSKLVMTTNKNKKSMHIASIAEKALNDMLFNERKRVHGSKLLPWTKDENNSNRVKVEVMLDSETFIFNFKYKGENRQLWLHTTCDMDSYDITDNKSNVMFSLNMWGNYKEVLTKVYEGLKESEYSKKKFFFDFNDCDNIYHKVQNNELVKCIV
jgi:hypothetical protein